MNKFVQPAAVRFVCDFMIHITTRVVLREALEVDGNRVILAARQYVNEKQFYNFSHGSKP